jgi:hypothetical protein
MASTRIGCRSPTTPLETTLSESVQIVVLHVAGKHLVARGLDHPFGAAVEVKPFGIQAAHVAGVKPAVGGDRLAGGLLVVDVAGKGLRPAEANVADLPFRHCRAGAAVGAHRFPD